MTALRRCAARLFLALAFLAGSQAALLHPLAHLDRNGEFVHLHGGHSDENRSESGPLCDALAALGACAPVAAAALPAFQQPDNSLPTPVVGAPRVAEAPPFLAQGPPASV
jgi:hypothetical protein